MSKRYLVQRVYIIDDKHLEFSTRAEETGRFNREVECDGFMDNIRKYAPDANFKVTEYEPEYGGGQWTGLH